MKWAMISNEGVTPWTAENSQTEKTVHEASFKTFNNGKCLNLARNSSQIQHKIYFCQVCSPLGFFIFPAIGPVNFQIKKATEKKKNCIVGKRKNVTVQLVFGELGFLMNSKLQKKLYK